MVPTYWSVFFWNSSTEMTFWVDWRGVRDDVRGCWSWLLLGSGWGCMGAVLIIEAFVENIMLLLSEKVTFTADGGGATAPACKAIDAMESVVNRDWFDLLPCMLLDWFMDWPKAVPVCEVVGRAPAVLTASYGKYAAVCVGECGWYEAEALCWGLFERLCVS